MTRPDTFKVGDRVFRFELTLDDEPNVLVFQITMYGAHRWEVMRLKKDGTLSGIRYRGAFHSTPFNFKASSEESRCAFVAARRHFAEMRESQAKRARLEADLAEAAVLLL